MHLRGEARPPGVRPIDQGCVLPGPLLSNQEPRWGRGPLLAGRQGRPSTAGAPPGACSPPPRRAGAGPQRPLRPSWGTARHPARREESLLKPRFPGFADDSDAQGSGRNLPRDTPPPGETGPRGSRRDAPVPPAAAAKGEESSGRGRGAAPTEQEGKGRVRHERAKASAPLPTGTRAAPAARVLPGRRPGKRRGLLRLRRGDHGRAGSPRWRSAATPPGRSREPRGRWPLSRRRAERTLGAGLFPGPSKARAAAPAGARNARLPPSAAPRVVFSSGFAAERTFPPAGRLGPASPVGPGGHAPLGRPRSQILLAADGGARLPADRARRHARPTGGAGRGASAAEVPSANKTENLSAPKCVCLREPELCLWAPSATPGHQPSRRPAAWAPSQAGSPHPQHQQPRGCSPPKLAPAVRAGATVGG